MHNFPAILAAAVLLSGCVQPITDAERAQWDANYFRLFGEEQDWRCQAAYREAMGGLRTLDTMLAVCADTAPTQAAHERTCSVANQVYRGGSITLEANQIICTRNGEYPN